MDLEEITYDKIHINLEGVAGKCNAEFSCPFGDLTKDHYKTKKDAQQAYETKMQLAAENERLIESRKASCRLGSPILTPPNKLSLPLSDAKYYLRFETSETHDHEGEDVNDYCRCGVIADVSVPGWDNYSGDGFSNFVKSSLGLKHNETLPKDLKESLTPFSDFSTIQHDFDAQIAGGYYGEELGAIKAPPALMAVLENYYYSKDDAAGPENIFVYLREKGYATAGERPLEAIKGALRAENNGRKIMKVEKAKKWRAGKIQLSSIATPSSSQLAAAKNDPRPPVSVMGTKVEQQRNQILGVVLEVAPNRYELIDGYHRYAFSKNANKKSGRYIVLSHEEPETLFYSWQKEDGWLKE